MCVFILVCCCIHLAFVILDHQKFTGYRCVTDWRFDNWLNVHCKVVPYTLITKSLIISTKGLNHTNTNKILNVNIPPFFQNAVMINGMKSLNTILTIWTQVHSVNDSCSIHKLSLELPGPIQYSHSQLTDSFVFPLRHWPALTFVIVRFGLSINSHRGLKQVRFTRYWFTRQKYRLVKLILGSIKQARFRQST